MDEKPIQILLVEDEKTHVQLIQRAFESRGGAVSLTVARTLQEARAHLAQSPPDLMIVDLVLPDGKGTELLPLDKEECRLPIVLMTCRGSEQVAVDAIKAGALDYVVKSEATLSDMPRIAERALRQWEQITERKWAEEALQKAHQQLDGRVRERTSQLSLANHTLRQEIAERERIDQELRETLEYLSGFFSASKDAIAYSDIKA